MISGVVRGLLDKVRRGQLKRFARFQRLIIEFIAWEPVKSADSKITGDVE